MSLVVPPDAAEEARARLVELAPDGFEERDVAGGLELAAYVDAAGEERLRAALGPVEAHDVEPGWEERWRDFHRGVAIGCLWAGPPWEEPPPGALAVVVDPGRAFGTGAHPTTRLCLELLQELGPGSLLDVGCGSGVLSIAAAKLGFGPVLGVDVDPLAIEATLANARVNAVEVAARLLDATTIAALPEAAVAVANISETALSALAPRLRSPLVVTSGYYASHPAGLDGHVHVARRRRDGWAGDLYRRAQAPLAGADPQDVLALPARPSPLGGRTLTSSDPRPW